MRATAKLRRNVDDAYVVDVAGGVDVTNAAQFEADLLDNVAGLKDRIALNLTALNSIDAAGLSVLITLSKLMKSSGAALDVICPSPAMRRLFDVTGLSQMLSVRSSEIRPNSAPAR